MHADPPNIEPSDTELMAAMASGEMRALGELVRRHQRNVRSLAYRITGRWDVADDISQEAFLRVLRAAPTYKPAASFTTWLYRIVVNLCLDAQRYRGTLQLVREEDQYAATRPVDRRLVQDEAVHAVQGEVAALPERERIVVVLHRFQGLSHCQIAQATGWTEPAVESLLVRAYARLRERLHEWAEI